MSLLEDYRLNIRTSASRTEDKLATLGKSSLIMTEYTTLYVRIVSAGNRSLSVCYTFLILVYLRRPQGGQFIYLFFNVEDFNLNSIVMLGFEEESSENNAATDEIKKKTLG